MRINNPVNLLIMLIMVQTMFVFSCSGDSEVQLGNVVKLPEDSSNSTGSPRSSSSVTRVSSSSVVDISSSSLEVNSSSSEAEVVEDSSSSEASSSSLEVSSSSSEAASSSSNVVACTSGPGTPVTHDGHTYQTVKIGCQTWMAENLNYDQSSSRCHDDKPANCSKYGRLYYWATAMEPGVCPTGWHIPSDAEWDALMEYVQTQNGGTYSPAVNASVAGEHLKAKADDWNGKDTYGFKALPGGYYGSSFAGLGSNGYWWSSTENGTSAWRRSISSTETVVRSTSPKTNLLSVRCIQGN